MEARNVNLRLPRLDVEGSFDLERVLVAAGLDEAFSEERGADHSGMCLRSRLQAKFLHRSFVQVTEDDAEANGIGYMVSSVGGCEQVHCNHPFLFFIRHRESSSILSFGRFSSP